MTSPGAILPRRSTETMTEDDMTCCSSYSCFQKGLSELSSWKSWSLSLSTSIKQRLSKGRGGVCISAQGGGELFVMKFCLLGMQPPSTMPVRPLSDLGVGC